MNLKNLLLVSITLLVSSQLHAAEITQQIDDAGKINIYINGKIVKGDYDKLRDMLKLYYYDTDTNLALVRLNSPGGDVDEGIKIAYAIKSTRPNTLVGKNDSCTGLCFILFAAGDKRYLDKSAKINAQHVNSKEGKIKGTILANMDMIYKYFMIPSEISEGMKRSYPNPYLLTDADKHKFIFGDSPLPVRFIGDGSAESTYLKGLEYFINKDYAKAKPLFEEAAKHSYPSALYVLANMYKSGYVVKRDMGIAIDYRNKAAELGHARAQIWRANEVGFFDSKKELDMLTKIRGTAKRDIDSELAYGQLYSVLYGTKIYSKFKEDFYNDWNDNYTDWSLLLMYSDVVRDIDKEKADYYYLLSCAAVSSFACAGFEEMNK